MAAKKLLYSFTLLLVLSNCIIINITHSTPTTTTPTSHDPSSSTISIPSTSTVAATTTSTTSTTTPPTPTTKASTTITTAAPVSKEVVATTTIKPDSGPKAMTTINPETIAEMRKIIHKHMDKTHADQNRILLNKPSQSPRMSDYAPESSEFRVAEATSSFGLHFLNTVGQDSGQSTQKQVVISPLSLQNLMNMLLMGTKENSVTEQELIKVLGYDTTALLIKSPDDRLRPHEAMHSVVQNIMAATHLSPNGDLLNTNPSSLNEASQTSNVNIEAHLQTSAKDNAIALNEQVNFTLANLILSNSDMITLDDQYEKDLKHYYNAKFESFSTNSTTSKSDKGAELPLFERVNKWVSNATHKQIDKLVDEADLDVKDLVMVLLNAAHFKGRWLHTFNHKATYEGNFYNKGSDTDVNSKVSFMRQKGSFGYADFSLAGQFGDGFGAGSSMSEGSRAKVSEDSDTVLTEDAVAVGVPSDQSKSSAPGSNQSDHSAPTIELSKEEAKRMELTSKLNCTVLMMPFSLDDGEELSMVVLLPSKRDGLRDMLSNLNGSVLNEVYKALGEQQVQVEMPKFSVEATYDAKAALMKMGAKSIFSDTANFDRMIKLNLEGKKVSPEAQVNKIIHKAKIAVDETGAEASAASAATIVLRNFIRQPTPVFVANHPFLYVIRHNRSNMPLFMGTIETM